MGGSAISVIRVKNGTSGHDLYSLHCNQCDRDWDEDVSWWTIKNTWKPVKCSCGANRAAKSLWLEQYKQESRRKKCSQTQS